MLLFYLVALSLVVNGVSKRDEKLGFALSIIIPVLGALFFRQIMRPAYQLAYDLLPLGRKYVRLPLLIQMSIPLLGGLLLVALALWMPDLASSNEDLYMLIFFLGPTGLAVAGALWRRGTPEDSRALRMLRFPRSDDPEASEAWFTVGILGMITFCFMVLPPGALTRIPWPSLRLALVILCFLGTIACSVGLGALGMHLRLRPKPEPAASKPEPVEDVQAPAQPPTRAEQTGTTLAAMAGSCLAAMGALMIVGVLIYLYFTPPQWVPVLLFIVAQSMAGARLGHVHAASLWAPKRSTHKVLYAITAALLVAWVLAVTMVAVLSGDTATPWGIWLVGFGISQLMVLCIILGFGHRRREQRAGEAKKNLRGHDA